MFPSKELWPSAVFGAVMGGMICVLFLKLLEKKDATEIELDGPDYMKESPKRPQEHDERLC